MNTFFMIIAGYVGFSFFAGIFAYCLCSAARIGDRLSVHDREPVAPAAVYLNMRAESTAARSRHGGTAVQQF